MPVEDSLKKIEERLTRLEAVLAQQAPGAAGGTGFVPPGGTVVDPAPYGGGGGWGQARAIQWPPHWPTPVVDPAPWWPTPVVDPAPWWGGGFPRPRPIVDPAVFAGGAPGQAAAATTFARFGHIGDPPPIDLSRLNVSQLESALHSVNAEKARLASLETLINQHLERAKQPG